MSDLATRIARRLSALGLTERAASMQATGSPNTIRNIRIGDSKHPRQDTLEKLAATLRTTPEWLTRGAGPEEVDGEERSRPEPDARPAPVEMPSRAQMPRDVPVLGTAAGSAIGQGAFQISEGVIDYVARPPGLMQSRDVYALFVENVSMEPLYRAGDLIFVSPHRPYRVGDCVVVQEAGEHDGDVTAYVKIFEKRTGEHIVTRQLNPNAEVKFRNSGQVRIHKVLTTNELFGV